MKKTVSYIARNERKYVDRRIAKLRQDLKTQSKREKTATRNYIKQLKTLKKKTYIKKRTPEARAASMEAVLKLRSLARIGKNTKIARQNKVFEREINLASTGASDTFMGHARRGKALVSLFYHSTRNIWQGKDPRKRNEYIMLALNKTSLKETFLSVIKANRKAINILTTNAGDAYQIDNIVSPTGLAAAKQIEDESDLEATYNSNDPFNDIGQRKLLKKLKEKWDESSGDEEEFRNAVEEEYENNKEGFEDLKESLDYLESQKELTEMLGEELENISSSAIDLAESAGESIGEFAESAGESIGEGAESVLNFVIGEGTMSEIGESLSAAWEEGGFLEVLSQIIDVLPEFI